MFSCLWQIESAGVGPAATGWSLAIASLITLSGHLQVYAARSPPNLPLPSCGSELIGCGVWQIMNHYQRVKGPSNSLSFDSLEYISGELYVRGAPRRTPPPHCRVRRASLRGATVRDSSIIILTLKL